MSDNLVNMFWFQDKYNNIDFHLSNIVVLYTALLCKDFSCSVSSHITNLDLFYQNIIDACVFATNDAIPCRNLSRPRDKHNHFPGWTPELNHIIIIIIFI